MIGITCINSGGQEQVLRIYLHELWWSGTGLKVYLFGHAFLLQFILAHPGDESLLGFVTGPIMGIGILSGEKVVQCGTFLPPGCGLSSSEVLKVTVIDQLQNLEVQTTKTIKHPFFLS